MVDRADRAPVATFYSPDSFVAGSSLTLGDDVAHHARVTRVAVGETVALRDGVGGIATGMLARIARSTVNVDVVEVRSIEKPPEIHLLAPVADRERMLWLGEKAAEFGIATWRPVMWRRSKSVSPRGEGPMFQAKLKARMVSALTQSGGAWLPVIFPEAAVEAALAATPPGSRILLDKAGDGGIVSAFVAPVSIAVGPEGGIETAEKEAFLAKDFKPMKVAGTTLRFETAGVAGIALVINRLSQTNLTNG